VLPFSCEVRPIPARLRLSAAILLVTLLAALLFRCVDLDRNPPGLWQDEASTGVDAYWIWKTGRDRAGVRFPVLSPSFGDYPLTLYRYLDAPIVGLLGMSPSHERAVSMLFGTMLVPLIGLAALLTLARRRPDHERDHRVALTSTIAAALGPELIQFSRYGSEAILLPFMLVLGWALFEIGRDPRRRIALYGGALALAASAYTYHAVKIFLPIWMVGLLFYLAPLIKQLWAKEKQHVFGPMILFTVCTIPSIRAALSWQGMYRGTCVMAWYRFHGFELVRVMMENYLSYFEPRTLFARGGTSRVQSIIGLGELNLIDAPFFITGLASMIAAIKKRREGWQAQAFILFWFLTGPLPGGMSYEPGNIGRVIAWFPSLSWISGIGAVAIFDWVQSRALPRAAVIALRAGGAIAVIATAAWIAWCTLERYPRLTERDWQADISGALLCAAEHRKTEQIIVSNRFPYANLFATFFLQGLPQVKGKAWAIEERTHVRANELYVFPTTSSPPKGTPVCSLRFDTGGSPVAFVYGPMEGTLTSTEAPPRPREQRHVVEDR
jgi:hypothetical protein